MNFSRKCLQYQLRHRTGHTLFFMQSVLNYQGIAIQLIKFVANVCSFPGLNLKENSSNGRGDMGKIYIGLQVKGP